MYKRMIKGVVRRVLITLLLIVICFALQTSVLRLSFLGNVSPNLMLVLTVSVALMRGEIPGLLTGFFCGFTVDVFFGNLIGFYAMVLMYIGFFCARFHKTFFPE
ncbi:MAG: rod shape-determining protein MreD, partial [Lachnospiraceae bacterium]|nr:rod shape-determining protein MreD [Lachnospiraceae bacterium]